jgi:very-short-patch-repair endonuclease
MKIEFSRELVEDMAAIALEKEILKLKEKDKIKEITKYLFETKFKHSLDAIDKMSESPIEKQFGYALLAGFWSFSCNSIFVPPTPKTKKEKQLMAKKLRKKVSDLKFFENIIMNSEFLLFPNNWVSPKIRADFIITDNSNGKSVIVECDSFQWHGNRKAFEKDKKREREIIKLGYPVLRYSGAEIINNPIETVIDIIGYLKQNQYEQKKNDRH